MSTGSISNSTAAPVQVAPPPARSQRKAARADTARVAATAPAKADASPVRAEATPVKVATPTASAANAVAQEAMETQDVTMKEAAKGDRQATRLLAQEAAAAASRGGVDVHA